MKAVRANCTASATSSHVRLSTSRDASMEDKVRSHVVRKAGTDELDSQDLILLSTLLRRGFYPRVSTHAHSLLWHARSMAAAAAAPPSVHLGTPATIATIAAIDFTFAKCTSSLHAPKSIIALTCPTNQSSSPRHRAPRISRPAIIRTGATYSNSQHDSISPQLAWLYSLALV